MAMPQHNGTWILTHKEYQSLKEDSDWLSCLERAGVDNWSGCEIAMTFQEEEEED